MVLAVDLESMNPGVQVLEVKNSQSVKIESVKFDPRFENKQRLRMIFTNVVSSTLANLEVTETVQVMNIPLYFLVRSIWLQNIYPLVCIFVHWNMLLNLEQGSMKKTLAHKTDGK